MNAVQYTLCGESDSDLGGWILTPAGMVNLPPGRKIRGTLEHLNAETPREPAKFFHPDSQMWKSGKSHYPAGSFLIVS
jgi:hypothetical protein